MPLPSLDSLYRGSRIFAFAALALAAVGQLRVEPTTSTNADEKQVIMQITSIFENSTTELRYGYCEDIHDGRGYTFGFAGFTSGTFDGTMLLKEYLTLRPKDNPLARYISAFEAIDRGPHDHYGLSASKAGLNGFEQAVKSCGDDPAFRQAQHALADRLYWNPSQAAAETLGAHLPITRGQLYDAYINHGEGGAAQIIAAANRRAGGTPRDGIDEKRWLAAFLEARIAVLKADKTWAESIDRVKVYQKLLTTGNVALNRPITVSCYGDTFTVK